MLVDFLVGRASDPQLNLVLVIWDEFWNTPAQDIDNGIELISTVTQTVTVTMVLTGDPFQLKPVEGRLSVMAGPFHELSRGDKSMLPRLSRRKLLQNLLTIPGESHRTRNASPDIAELVHAAARIEMLLRVGDLARADKELVELQNTTAGLRLPPGNGAVYLTATRERQLMRQREALRVGARRDHRCHGPRPRRPKVADVHRRRQGARVDAVPQGRDHATARARRITRWPTGRARVVELETPKARKRSVRGRRGANARAVPRTGSASPSGSRSAR